MAGVRLPLQVGRAAIAQGSRFAATIWLGVLLLLLGTFFFGNSERLLGLAMAFVAICLLAIAVEAADIAKRDRPSDLALDATGFTVAGGPLDGTRCAWSEVDLEQCEIVDADPRLSVRWLLLKWLTFGQVGFIASRVRVPVVQLRLPRRGKGEPLLLAEAEGDERESLEHLRDSIRGVADPVPVEGKTQLPQEILSCPSCGAPQVPADATTMPCSSCGHVLDVPAELRQRLHARAVLEQTSTGRADLVRRLVDQPSARRAGHVVYNCRRLMFWSQPAAIIGLIVYMVHQTGHIPGYDETCLVRATPSDDGLLMYDLVLGAAMIAAAFVIAWALASAYVANRSALRILADQFGAVPPAKPGGASSCRSCGAPLPATTALLVHCVYCSTENVLGVDPRPAALRRSREKFDLTRALRRRRWARLRVWITLPLCVALGFATARQIKLAWGVPEHSSPFAVPVDYGPHGTIHNTDLWPRAVEVDHQDVQARGTVLGHSTLIWSCSDVPCTVRVGSDQLTFDQPYAKIDLEIAHQALRRVTP